MRSWLRAHVLRRPDASAVVAVCLVALAVGGVIVMRDGGSTSPQFEPSTAALNSDEIVCPSPIAKTDKLAHASGNAPRVTTQTVPRRGRVIRVTLASKVPLVAAEWHTKPLAYTTCAQTTGESWFNGVGAGPTHDSIVQIVNTDDSQAVVDLTVYGSKGLISADALGGIAVPGNSSTKIDLGKVIPQSGVLSLHANVERGRAAVMVLDQTSPVTSTVTTREFAPSGAAASRNNLILGIANRKAPNTLVLTNPGVVQVTAHIKLVTSSAIFTPLKAPIVDVAPQSVVSVDLTKLLSSSVAAGTIGLEIDSNARVNATLRESAPDIALAPTVRSITDVSTVILPSGQKTLVLAGATARGVVTVSSQTAQGKVIKSQRVALVPRRGASVTLPKTAVLVTVTPEGTAYGAAVVVKGNGYVIVPFRPLNRQTLLPHLAPYGS